MWLFTNPKCSHYFDNGWDGEKISGTALTPQIFAVEPDGNYQVDAVDDINNTLLGFQAGEDKNYTLIFTHQNLKDKYENLYLYDISANITIDITESGSTYSFTSEASPASQKRFLIVASNIKKGTIGNEKQLNVFSLKDIVFVQNLSNSKGEIIIYSMKGRQLKRTDFNSYGLTAIGVDVISGVYLVNATTSTERVIKKVIIRKLDKTL
jgi:hypothetical protein